MSTEQELERLRKLYGAKFNAIGAALGYVSEAILRLENDRDDESAMDFLRQAERVLVDA